MTKEEVVSFLFWLQYREQESLIKDWNNSLASNRFVAQKYLEWLNTPNESIGIDH